MGNLEAWVDDIFEAIDTDGSGEIEFTEWEAAALQNLAHTSDEALRAAFRVFDLDEDGQISKQEFARVTNLSPEELSSFFTFDLDGDGLMSFEEFKQMIAQPVSSGNTSSGFPKSPLGCPVPSPQGKGQLLLR